jgi:hypothetical protein
MSTEPTESHDRDAQEDTEKPDVDSLFDAPPRSEVVPLETLRRNDLERGGGKGANLGELISVGLPVPPGFCVTTAAYRRAVAETGLAEAIDAALRDVRDEDLASAEAASAGIGTLFEDLPLPDDLAEAILAATALWAHRRLRYAPARPQRTCQAPASPASGRRQVKDEA